MSGARPRPLVAVIRRATCVGKSYGADEWLVGVTQARRWEIHDAPYTLFPTLGDAAMDDDNADGVDIHKFATYEDYLDSQITEQDKFYLEVSPCRAARGEERPSLAFGPSERDIYPYCADFIADGPTAVLDGRRGEGTLGHRFLACR